MSPSEGNFNLFKNFPLLPPKPISGSIGLTTTTTSTAIPITSSFSNTLVPQINSDLSKSIPAVTNPIGSSSLTQMTAPTTTLQLPTSELR